MLLMIVAAGDASKAMEVWLSNQTHVQVDPRNMSPIDIVPTLVKVTERQEIHLGAETHSSGLRLDTETHSSGLRPLDITESILPWKMALPDPFQLFEGACRKPRQ